MALTLIDLETVLAEIQPVVTGGWIQKIHQPQDTALTLEVQSHGASIKLYICAEPHLGRLHFVSKKYPNPLTPPSFCQFLRAHVEGGRIETIMQQPGDRLVYLTIRKDRKACVLVVALLGNRTNILLLNEKYLLLQSLKESRFQIGERFVPPGTGSSSTQSYVPLWTKHDLQKHEDETASFAAKYPVSAAMEAYYDKKEEEGHQRTLYDQQLAHTKKMLRLAKGKLRALEADLQKAERYREYARYGELMKSALHDMHKGQETATLTDYFDSALPTVTLPLDPSKDPVRNMEDYFHKHHKYLGAQKHLMPRIEMQYEKIAKLEEQLTQIEQGIMDPAFSLKTGQTRQPPPPPRPSKIKPQPAQGYRMYTSAEGIPILVGKTAKDNDHLTFKVGNPDDLWLHARGTPGSHVIVRLEKGQTVPHETLKDAATLTLWFSDLRKSGKGEVIYTLRKFVKKGTGFKPGAVQVTRDKSMWIELKDDRLERLKGSPT